MTANLHITVERAAKLFNVSVRNVHYARRLQATGRDDLYSAVAAGKMSLHRALIEAGVKRPPNNPSLALFSTWDRASDIERQTFVDWLSASGQA